MARFFSSKAALLATLGVVAISTLSSCATVVPDQKRAIQLHQTLLGPKFQGENSENYLCPSFNTQDPRFNGVKYWRGPVWINMNWLIYNGLNRYGFSETAEIVKKDSLDLVLKHGLWEYFEPNRAKAAQLADGCGAPNFSWTAALVLDFLKS